jgi:hypothetical protein
MPPEDGDFPFEVQQAMYVHTVLPDRWDGMSGTYMGKDWSALGTILDVSAVEDKRTVCFFLKYIENAHMININDELKYKRDALKRAGK